MLEIMLEWTLRGFGLFWIVGGGVAIHKARQAAFIDHVLGALSGTPEDPLLTRFLFVGAVLTLISGIGLTFASVWALVPLVLLVMSQLVYFKLLKRKHDRAQTDEERDEARPQQSTVNAFWLSLLLTMATVLAVWLGCFA